MNKAVVALRVLGYTAHIPQDSLFHFFKKEGEPMLQYYIVFMAGVFATLLVQEGLPLVARGLRKA